MVQKCDKFFSSGALSTVAREGIFGERRRNCSLGGGLGVGVCMISFVCILLLKEISW